jgi:hypothetical protein
MRQRQQVLNTHEVVVSELLERTYQDNEILLQRTQEQPLDVLISGVLERLVEKETNRKRITTRLFGVLCISILLLLLRFMPSMKDALPWLYMLLPSLMMAFVWAVRPHAGRWNLIRLVVLRRQELLPEHVPLLIALLDTNPFTVDNYVGGNYYRVRLELCSLLARYTDAECRALADRERAYLRSWLSKGTVQEKVVALLVLSSAADKASLPQVQALMHDSDTQVREAAKEFLRRESDR